MPFQKYDEPIPQHVLQKFLGRGALGEVWLARGPGGVQKAVKFMRLERSGIKELMAIQRIKQIHHAHLVQITDVWMLDRDGQLIPDEAIEQVSSRLSKHGKGSAVTQTMVPDQPAEPDTLVVAMTLANGNLFERLEKFQQEGLPGIPREELLSHMQESAKGLDFLNQPHPELGGKSIQHCDVKPQNLLLVGDSVQVCDFGLARLVGEHKTMNQVEGTLAYIAPEAARGKKPTSTTDQYSLAISYYELLTGKLPFETDAAAFQILDIHMSGKLDFSAATPAEQQVLRKATSVKPEKRYPTNREFVEALVRANSPDPKPSGRWKSAVFLLPLLLVGVGAILFVVLDRLPDPISQVQLPTGFSGVSGEEPVKIGDRLYPTRIVKTTVGGQDVGLVLVHEPSEEQLFYIMENKVWNSLFAEFLDSQGVPSETPAARTSEGLSDKPTLPVFNVPVEQAYDFARWLGGDQGHLPSVKQWDTAAGLYRAERTGSGPFQEPYDPGQIAVGRPDERPMPVGLAEKDLSPFRVRDMAGNGLEFTRDIWPGPSEVPIPKENLSSVDIERNTDAVMRRGRSFDSVVGPLSFAVLKDRRQDLPWTYLAPSPDTTFRVVLQKLAVGP
jgi:serine/threonine protein kinase